MNEFDIKAAGWDSNLMHHERSKAVADGIMNIIPLNKQMTALEYGAGTGLTGFLLKDHLKEIILTDSSTGMISIMDEKITAAGATNLKTLFLDLEKSDFEGARVDFIFSQMVLHHVTDTGSIIRKFHSMLNPGGYLAIADLYPEDGSFHGEGFTGHKGFNPGILAEDISRIGFTDISHRKCFAILKKINDSEMKKFDLFLLTARRG
jgi:ubiquinone/menaquinone biosynthesis C-methylase UbiE